MAATLSADGRWLAWIHCTSGTTGTAVHFLDLVALRHDYSLEAHPQDTLCCLALAPDGQTLATGSEDGTVRLWPWRALLER